ncbi:hypothetical protein [Streptomyces sp. 6N223]|uniref:hypothetical protein n=1 Tax=Streptomyces sp. 6N223 TaxID=3457412 RepID=UPI003FD5900A
MRVEGVRLVHPPATPPPVVAAALGQIDRGRAAADTSRPHELIAFTDLCVPEDRERIAPVLAGQAEWLGIPPEEAFLAAGDPATAAERVRELGRAGATTVVLRPIGPDPLTQFGATLAALREKS